MTRAAAKVTNPSLPKAIPLGAISESKTNPRATFDKAQLDELTESVRKHGVLQPILVRPLKGRTRAAPRFEIVCGHRRFRAAKAAKLASIPATVQALDDREVLEIQVIENLQRADLHPLEEAEGYSALTVKHGLTVEELAAKVGKSKAYVYQRLKFCGLPKAAKDAFRSGTLDAARALLVARIPNPKLAEQATKEIVQPRHGGDVLSFRDAERHVREHYMLRLDQAPFQTGDATLVRKAGSCAACPKRAGAQADLFGAIKGPDLCLDPACWRQKLDALWERMSAEWKAAGKKVLSKAEAREVWPHAYTDDPTGKWVSLEGRTYSGGSYKPWRQLLKGKEIEVALGRNPHTGAIHELVARATAERLARTAPSRTQASAEEKARRKAEKAEKAFRQEAGRQVFNLIRGRLEAEERAQDDDLAKVLVECTLHDPGYGGLDGLYRLCNPDAPGRSTDDYNRAHAWFKDLLAENRGRRLAVAVLLTVAGELREGIDGKAPATVEAARLLGIDLDGTLRKIAEESGADGIRRCRQCGCTDLDCRQCIEKTGEACWWVEKDLCSACDETSEPDFKEPEEYDPEERDADDGGEE